MKTIGTERDQAQRDRERGLSATLRARLRARAAIDMKGGPAIVKAAFSKTTRDLERKGGGSTAGQEAGGTLDPILSPSRLLGDKFRDGATRAIRIAAREGSG